MKVLYSTYPEAFQNPGGGEVQLIEYQKNISEFGLKVNFFNQWKTRITQYDLLHFFSCMPGSEHFLHYVKSFGIPVYISPNLWITKETKNKYPFVQIQSQLNIADRIICNSKAECETLSRIFEIDIKKFICVYNGVEKIFFQPIDPKIFRDHYQIESKFILNVANIEPRKNQLNLIKAIKKFPTYKLVIMGGVRDREYANQVIAEGGSQLILIDRQEHGSEMQRSAYAACDLFALPSTLETPGLAALEASACGAPILITEEGCTREYFEDLITYVDPYSIDSIEYGIKKSLNNPNPGLSDLIRDKYTWSKVLEPLLRSYLNQDFFGEAINSKNFYPAELLQEKYFIWSKYHCHFEVPMGVLTFQWRAPQRASVDIYLNNQLYQSNIQVDTHWQNYSISTIESKTAGLQVIELKIRPIEPIGHLNVRELGVAIQKFRFLEQEKNTQISNLLLWYQQNDKYLESVGITKIWGFNLPEETPDGTFIWSKYHCHFEVPMGVLTFQWRAPQRASVDIYLNNQLYQSNIQVDTHWQNYSISTIEGKTAGLQVIELKIRPIEPIGHRDTRELGVGLLNVCMNRRAT